MAILEVHGLHGQGQNVTLAPDQREYVIGRRETCDVVIEHDEAVSREHLCVELKGSGWQVTDLDARNGTHVNGEPLVRPRILHHRDEVELGRHTKLVFRDAQSAQGGTTSVVDPAPTLTPGQRRVLVELLRPMYEGGGVFTMPTNVAGISEALFIGDGAVKNQLGGLYDKYDIPPVENKADEPRFVRLARAAYLRGPVSAKDYAKGVEERLMAERIADRYEITETIRERAGRTLARALDHFHDPPRTVALKLVELREGRTKKEIVDEGVILMDLASHPGIPRFWHSFDDGDRHVLVMEWVEGIDLDQELVERGEPGLTLTTVVDYVRQAAAALDHLHAHDPPIVHGDVKPANLVRRRDGLVVLVDYGIARAAGVRSREGTFGYVAPEITAGEATSPAQDVYGLASTAFTLLTGRSLAEGGPDWGPLDPDDVPNLVATLQRALEPDPSKRPTAGDFAERLANAAAALPTGVVTFLAVEVHGSDDFWERDADAMDDVHQRVDALTATAVAERAGRVVVFGNRRMAVFPSVVNAVRCSLVLHEQIGEQRWPSGFDVRLRVGVHTGEASLRNGRYTGRTPNHAERLCTAARPGTTAVSRATAQLLDGPVAPDVRLVPETTPGADHFVLLRDDDDDPEPVTQPVAGPASGPTSGPARRPPPRAAPLVPEAAADAARRRLVDAVTDALLDQRQALAELTAARARSRANVGDAATAREVDRREEQLRSAHEALTRARAALADHDAADPPPTRA